MYYHHDLLAAKSRSRHRRACLASCCMPSGPSPSLTFPAHALLPLSVLLPPSSYHWRWSSCLILAELRLLRDRGAAHGALRQVACAGQAARHVAAVWEDRIRGDFHAHRALCASLGRVAAAAHRARTEVVLVTLGAHPVSLHHLYVVATTVSAGVASAVLLVLVLLRLLVTALPALRTRCKVVLRALITQPVSPQHLYPTVLRLADAALAALGARGEIVLLAVWASPVAGLELTRVRPESRSRRLRCLALAAHRP
mmetsp:Transcript_13153/g.52494  ORF Transcript_13153/g.52494 Transcript_13153/m.52494 type:complete len:255 (-) Transcript_13153:156-920(-)